ncbi:hypothetical protein [Ensifer sp. B1-9]|uniref:hypothetical protein n=1 Tax=Ensifer sp. B1-9 TaxID=3141455 RepID=UPI003D2504A6
MKALLNKVRAFAREEDGVALTEYLVLLGLLSGGVIASVIAIGGDLQVAWSSWETFFGTGDLGYSATPPAP